MRLKPSSKFLSSFEVCVPYHFSGVPGPTNDRCSRWNLCAYSLTSSEFENTVQWIYILCQIDVIEHRHEQNCFLELFWIYFSRFQIFLDLSQNFYWCDSWEQIPLELHWISINSWQLYVLNWIVGSLGFDFSIFHSLLNDHAFFPDTRLNLSRHVPLPLPWMSDQEYFELNLHTNSILLRRYWADLPSEVCEITVLYSKIPQ